MKPTPDGVLPLVYQYFFADGKTWKHTLMVGKPEPATEAQADWTALGCNKCPHCPLDREQHPACPLAEALHPILAGTRLHVSHEPVDVQVFWRDREVRKTTSLQRGLSPLIGAASANSGCPHTEFLRPMLWFHQPFSDSAETQFRAVGSYLVGQHLRQRHGQAADFSLQGLQQSYTDLRLVNRCISQRLRFAAEEDASINSLILLDLLADDLLHLLDEQGDELDGYFNALFDT